MLRSRHGTWPTTAAPGCAYHPIGGNRGSLCLRARRLALPDGSALRHACAARLSAGADLPQANLPHEGYQIVEEVLLDDLSIVPPGDRAEVDFEFLAGWGNLCAIGPFHRARECAREVGDRAGPIAGGEEDAIGPVVEVLIGEGGEELDGLGAVIVHAVGWRFAWPRDDHIGFVALGEGFEILCVPGVIQCLHELHVARFGLRRHWSVPPR